MASALGGAVNMLQVSMPAWSLDAVDSLVTYARRLDCSRCVRFITTQCPSSPAVLSTAGQHFHVNLNLDLNHHQPAPTRNTQSSLLPASKDTPSLRLALASP
jgi:hypothetical protein